MSAVAEDRPLDVSSSSRSTLLWGPLTAFALAIAVATAQRVPTYAYEFNDDNAPLFANLMLVVHFHKEVEVH